MPQLTDENIARIKRLNEIADEARKGLLTPEEAEAQVQAILDEFSAQDGILSRAKPTIEEEPYERPIFDRLARYGIKPDAE